MRKKPLVFLASLVFLLSFCVVLFGASAAQAHEDDNSTGTDNDVSDDLDDDDNATSENENGDEDEGDDSASTTGRTRSEEHRSSVANFVHSLLDAADREEGGIGEQVRDIAREQNESASNTVRAIEKVEKRNKIQTFLFGSDYRNLGALRSEIVKTRNRLNQLSRWVESIQNASDTVEIQAQIQTLEQEQDKLENFVNEQEGKFSLFGWLVKMFSR